MHLITITVMYAKSVGVGLKSNAWKLTSGEFLNCCRRNRAFVELPEDANPCNKIIFCNFFILGV